ncbi:MAG: hypothetical protein M3O66_05745 [Verrucomicrobiota bacterium]|nr:hypothetical protein [Verrucomicrobiota bacterium]
MLAASLRALLSQSIDYAGMFPPCSLALEPALRNQAQYVRSPDAWMLSTFVLAVGQFDAARQNLSQFDPNHPLHISALGPKTDGFSAFREALAKTITAIRSFSAHNVDLVSINQLEMPLPHDADLNLLKDAGSIVANLTTFWEAPVDAASHTIDLLAEYNYSAGNLSFGYKLRTGGVTADAFPTSAQIARALVTPAKHQVPIKFTAGLHHPVRQFRDEVQTKMHGFLNVLGAAVLAAEHRWDERQTTIMLQDEDTGSFSFDDEFFAWREWRIETNRIEARRKFVTSFGSCSFDEPLEDLRALRLL